MRDRGMAVAVGLLAITGLLGLPAAPAHASPPADFQTSLVVGTGLDAPTGLGIAPDGRVFILERAGKVKIVKGGQLLAQPFADLPSADTGDRGLIGIAFDPNFGANHLAYFYYTGVDTLDHLVRFDASGDVATGDPEEIFRTSEPSQLLHVGGGLAFGPDGKLYFTVGDNGYPANGQDLRNPFGKVLRINRDGSVPTDNPFYGQPGKFSAIWAYGFRNPWRMQFDASTGQLYSGDVGDATWEELNHVVKGGNYGWPLTEGRCTSSCEGFTDPIYAYNHNGQSAAITCGPVYRGGMFPASYQGRLLFGDYALGFIKGAQLDSTGAVTGVSDFDTTAGSVVDLKTAADGSLYYITYYPGELYRVTYNTTAHPPIAVASANVTQGVEPLKVRFSSAGSSDPDGDPLAFRWDFGDGTTSTSANPKKTYSKRGSYIVQLTVSDGRYQTNAQPIVLQVGTPPVLNISAPHDGSLYRAGDTITYSASATDDAGRSLTGPAIQTEVRFHHETHWHPFLGPVPGNSSTFTIPTTGEASVQTWYEIRTTATDRNGLSTTKSVAIRPRTSQISLATNPPGMGLTVDGVPVTTPITIEAVVGFQRELAAPARQLGPDANPYHFTNWSDGGSIRHVIRTPDANTTYTATYARSTPFTGTYFDNPTLSGAPVLTRQDPQINFEWWLSSPDPSVPADRFSVRWTTTDYFAPATYRFTATTDDGVRLFIDGRLVIDHWQDQSATPYDYTTVLSGGNHSITMEYYENGWDAIAKLNWDSTR